LKNQDIEINTAILRPNKIFVNFIFDAQEHPQHPHTKIMQVVEP